MQKTTGRVFILGKAQAKVRMRMFESDSNLFIINTKLLEHIHSFVGNSDRQTTENSSSSKQFQTSLSIPANFSQSECNAVCN